MSGTTGFIVVICIFVAILAWLLQTFLETRKIMWIFEGGVVIFMGLIGGLLISSFDSHIQFKFDKNLFFFVLLPMIIFQEGYLLKKRYFFKYFYLIFLYGIMGTIITFLILYPINMLISNSDLIVVQDKIIHIDNYRVFLFSAIISSSECLSAKPFVDHHKYPKLFNILYGEQAMNDLIVFSLVIASAETYQDQLSHSESISYLVYLQIALFFLYEIVAAALIGFVFGLISTFITKACRFLIHSELHTIGFILAFGYFNFCFAKAFNLAGIVSILVAAVILSHYMVYNLHHTTQQKVIVSIKQLAFIFETLIFIYVGLQFSYFIIHYNKLAFSWSFVFIELTVLLITRFSVVFLLSGLTLLLRIKTKENFYLNCYELFLIATSGMVRGSIVYAFVQYFHANHYEDDPQKTLEDEEQVQLLQSTALAIIIITTFLFGGLLQPVSSYVLNRTQVEEEQKEEQSPELKKSEAITNPQKHRIRYLFKQFDQKFLKALFIYDYANRKDNLKENKEKFKDQSHDHGHGHGHGHGEDHSQGGHHNNQHNQGNQNQPHSEYHQHADNKSEQVVPQEKLENSAGEDIPQDQFIVGNHNQTIELQNVQVENQQ